jgi:hypothetical protein
MHRPSFLHDTEKSLSFFVIEAFLFYVTSNRISIELPLRRTLHHSGMLFSISSSPSSIFNLPANVMALACPCDTSIVSTGCGAIFELHD